MPTEQLNLSFNYLRNRSLLSSHWLENRLQLEPEWMELRDEAHQAFLRLVDLWQIQRGRVEHYGAEQPLEEGFIQPIFEIIGWKIFYQTYLKGRKPDYALFINDDLLDSAIRTGKNSPAFWEYPTLVADAKAWHISLDHPTKINNKKEYPPEQIEDYLKHSHLQFGILTNGRLWRLVPREYSLQQRRFQTYLELDLPQLLERWQAISTSETQGALFVSDQRAQIVDEFLRFYLFFNPKAFIEIDRRQPLIRRAVEGSSEYRVGVSEGLKERTFEALRFCVEGFLANPENELDPITDLELCREQSFVLLYRLLFVMYAEDRKLLPYKINQTYTNNRSLGRKRDEIAGRLDRFLQNRDLDYGANSTAIWSDLIDLFDLVDRGHGTYKVPAYNGGLFSLEAHSFLAEKQISDYYMARIIEQLGRAFDPNNQQAGLFRVDYHDLAIQHLGGIYEGLLELHPHYANERMIVVRKRGSGQTEERIQLASQAIPQGFEATNISYPERSVYLITDEGERRASGSYYTPDHIVEYIVENTLSPLCNNISRQLQNEIDLLQAQIETISSDDERIKIEREIERLKSDFDDRLLRLSVLDPSMGSGHFLIRACQYLAEEIATNPNTGDTNLTNAASDESALGFWKRRVVERCLYGVDMNPMAVELAKLALWLETVASDQPLSFLDHHLRHGNSLFGARLSELGVLHGEIRLLDNFVPQVEANLSVLLEPLAVIRNAPSNTIEQVKIKERLHNKFERVREPFRLVGDVWCAEFTREGKQIINSELYLRAVAAMTTPGEFNLISQEDWFQQSVKIARRRDMSCFHWELEFPEIFFGENGRLANPGFDAIIGNPPYDVLSEAELGQDLTTFKSFIAHETVYAPSRRGKNNLYKLFICRSLELLNNGGYLGFITPMAVLGDDQAADIRRRIVELGSFTGIETFPQKDNPKKRVFPDAKLSTTIFTLQKGHTQETNGREFISRVHPADEIKIDSPRLLLSTTSIPLYDPVNFSIVSCSQEDWNLATRIMQTGSLRRLGDFAEFFQGEINETNERRKGTISDNADAGMLILRASAVCLYVLREPSQNTTGDLYVSVERFLAGKREDSKAFAYNQPRIGVQGNAPQNNFRRIIASLIPEGTFCFYTINYCPASESFLPLPLLLALMNSKLSDWYFRLGSTNAHANQYQLHNLPCPVFSDLPTENDERIQRECFEALENGNTEQVLELLQQSLANPPFSLAIQSVIIEATNRIIEIETRRGEIPRAARSRLAPEAQIYQDLIDALFYQMAGLTKAESIALEERLSNML